jgi:hypothetical protein
MNATAIRRTASIVHVLSPRTPCPHRFHATYRSFNFNRMIPTPSDTATSALGNVPGKSTKTVRAVTSGMKVYIYTTKNRAGNVHLATLLPHFPGLPTPFAADAVSSSVAGPHPWHERFDVTEDSAVYQRCGWSGCCALLGSLSTERAPAPPAWALPT